jgi:hypothetical protein
VLKVYFVGAEVNFFIQPIDFLIHAFEKFQSFIIQKRTAKFFTYSHTGLLLRLLLQFFLKLQSFAKCKLTEYI